MGQDVKSEFLGVKIKFLSLLLPRKIVIAFTSLALLTALIILGFVLLANFHKYRFPEYREFIRQCEGLEAGATRNMIVERLSNPSRTQKYNRATNNGPGYQLIFSYNRNYPSDICVAYFSPNDRFIRSEFLSD